MLIKDELNDNFEVYDFENFFHDPKYLIKSFEQVKIMDNKTKEPFLKFIKDSMLEENIFFIGIGESKEDKKAVKNLKKSSFFSDSTRFGIIVSLIKKSELGEFEEGDMIIVQKNGKSKLMDDQNNILVKRIPAGLRKSQENLIKELSENLYESNVFLPDEVLPVVDLKYLIKCRYDDNKIKGLNKLRMISKVKSLREKLKDEYPELEKQCYFVEQKMPIKNDAEYEFLVEDIGREDMRTM